MSATILTKIFSLLTIENVVYGNQTPGKPDEWTVTITREARRFGAVSSLADYLAIKEKPREAPSPIISSGPRLTRRRFTDPGGYPVVPSAINDGLGIPGFQAATAQAGDDATLRVDDLHPRVAEACRDLFALRRFREAALAAVVAFRDQVRACTGLKHYDGADLMGKAFGGIEPPLDVTDPQLDPDTRRNIRQGMVHISQGLWFLVRNPLTHNSMEIEPTEAMRIVGLVDMLVRRVEDRPGASSPPPASDAATAGAT